GARFAPPITGTVVGANPGLLRQCWLHQSPVDRPAAHAGLQQHGWLPFTQTVKVQPVSADIDQPAWSGIGTPVVESGSDMKKGRENHAAHEQHKQTCGNFLDVHRSAPCGELTPSASEERNQPPDERLSMINPGYSSVR